MGSSSGYADERPARRICLSRYFVLETEVTVGAYARCVRAGRCTPPQPFAPSHPTLRLCNWGRPGRGQHPVNCVTAEQAAAFCAHLGGRLPTEAEWERAAAARRDGPFPWGAAPATPDRAVVGRLRPGGPRGTAPVGSRPEDRSRWGALDIVGNVSEWVTDWYAVRAYRAARQWAPRGPRHGRFRVVRGCSFRCPLGSLLLRRTARQVAGTWDPTVGFRCVRARPTRRGSR